jgi:hypothetical protein
MHLSIFNTMKRIISGGLFAFMLAACSKDEPVRPGSASLMIFNALPGAALMKTNFSTTPPPVYGTANSLIYGFFSPNTNLYHPEAGNVPLSLYLVPDTLPKNDPLFSLNLALPVGSIHSLFLAGTLAAPETVLVKDDLLSFAATDSAMGLRFANLMPEDIPVSINVMGKENGSEIDNLQYKEVTEFFNYPVRMGLADYVFEFRNANTGDVIASYTTDQIANDGMLSENVWIYKNFALALVGKINGTGAEAPRVVRIAYGRVF